LTDDEFDKLLVETLKLKSAAAFSDDTLMEDLPNLDSLRFMQLITAIEAQFGIALSADSLMDIERVADLRRVTVGASSAAG
jgi:acyl carrier protein